MPLIVLSIGRTQDGKVVIHPVQPGSYHNVIFGLPLEEVEVLLKKTFPSWSKEEAEVFASLEELRERIEKLLLTGLWEISQREGFPIYLYRQEAFQGPARRIGGVWPDKTVSLLLY